jgi:hypothetical protein
MSNLPGPAPWSEDDESDGITIWDEGMYWAERGDLRPLVEILRGNATLGPDDRAARDFIADTLAGQLKRRRGAPQRRPDCTFAIDRRGKAVWVDVRDVPRYEADRWIAEHTAQGMPASEALGKAADLFGIDAEELDNWRRRSKRGRERK